MDTTKLGRVAAELMEHLAENAEDGSEIGEVMILVEVTEKDGKDMWTGIDYRCSDPREWIQRGMLHSALDSERIPGDSDEEDDEVGTT